METGEIAGVYYNYQQGPKEGPTLLFIHGAGGTKKNWHYQWLEFKGKYSIIAVDLPGHGESSAASANKISDYSQAIAQLLKGLSLDRVILVGHSMGGAIAMNTFLDEAVYIAGLILVCTGAKLGVRAAILEQLAQDLYTREMIEFAYSPKASQKLIENGYKEQQKIPCSVTFGDFQACNSFDIRSQLANIFCPTLIMCGDEDQVTPLKFSLFLHEHIPNSSLAIIPLAGHMLMIEQPQSTNAVIYQFIKQFF
ncbi:MAG: alpha/beta hydrolase [Bacillota bacterium]|nr:alpha/beta hydrolase [Bacillota bacterium]